LTSQFSPSYLFLEVPETPRFCELHNDSTLEVICTAGNDGGLTQFFQLEVVGLGGGPSPFFNIDTMNGIQEITNNEISTMNDQVGFVVNNLQIK
jgi:hypothetical protein